MQKNKKQIHENVALMILMALFAALSILFGKYLAINLGDTIRFSFENLPILIAGYFFGPLAGACVGILADLVGCLLVGYSINPLITLGASLVGFCAGIGAKMPFRSPLLRVISAVILAHSLGSVFMKTLGFTVFYQSPFLATLIQRSGNYLIVSVLEFLILLKLVKSPTFCKQVRLFMRKRDESKEGEKK